MTEKEKMLNGLLYDGGLSGELAKERLDCQTLCYEYNNLSPIEKSKRNEIIKKLFNKTGEQFHIESPFHCDYGYNISIGEKFYANYNCIILDCAKVTIGNNVFIAPNVAIYTATHPIDKNIRNEGLEYAFPITIGNDVWIGGNVVILPGVKIGSNVVIGAGSVVTKDIPDNSIAYGNPCRVHKKL